jgi:hypothetical protein
MMGFKKFSSPNGKWHHLVVAFLRTLCCTHLKPFHLVKPLKGDNVVCQWGRGIVQEIRRNGTIVIQLSSWRLANRSLVKADPQTLLLEQVV